MTRAHDLGRRLRKYFGLSYDLHAESLRLDRLAGSVTPDPEPVNEDYEPEALSGDFPDISFLVGCERAGLLLVEGSRVRRLFRGRDYYGLTQRGGRWYTYHRFAGGNGCIISFRLEGDRAVDARSEVTGLLRGVHQIDFVDDSLWIVDTYHDRIAVVPEGALGAAWRGSADVHYPVGRDHIGREQPNHAHFNSVFGWDGRVFLVAHNEYAKTGRESELFVLSGEGEVLGREPLGGTDCHNIAFLAGQRITCRSREGTVAVDDREVLSLEGYVRGLALGHDFHAVGTSLMDGHRAKRAWGCGQVVVTDDKFVQLGTITLPKTQVFELRRVDAPDLGLSGVGRPASPAQP